MMTDTTEMRVWVGCLGCYNAGALVGDWIDATEAESLEPHDFIAQAGLTAPACGREKADERWCLDLEGFEGFVSGECSPSEAQRIAEAVENMDDDDRAAFGAWIGNGSGTIEDAESFREDYCGVWDSEKEYAQDFAEDIGAINEELFWPHDCIDWDHATRELFMGYWSAPASGGRVFVFRRN